MTADDDLLAHYGLTPISARAATAVWDALEARGVALPSDDVIDKALSALGVDEHGPRPVRAHTLVYKARSASEIDRTHTIILYRKSQRSSKIVDYECSCDARRLCWHILYSLSCAERDGYHLQRGETS
jgi:hypothetical protein